MNFGLNAAGVNPTISSLASNLAGTLAGLSGFGLGFKGLNALGGAIANGLQGSPTRKLPHVVDSSTVDFP